MITVRRKNLFVVALILLTASILIAEGERDAVEEKNFLNQLEVPVVSADRIRDYVVLFSSIKSRFTGYPGSLQAARIIAEEFNGFGLKVSFFNYTVLVPYDSGSYMKVGGKVIKAYGLYPNVVATGLKKASGKLVYAGYGTPEELNGLDVNGSIVLLEFNSGSAWVDMVKLGASGIVFLEDGDTNRFEALSKISSVPLVTPRIYVTGQEASQLREIARTNPDAELFNGMEWREVEAVNVIGEMRGVEDPSKVIIITVNYDSGSIVPGFAPGADEAIGVSVMLEFIRALKQQGFTPRYTVLFIAMSGHWQALAGARSFVEQFYFNNSEIGSTVFPYLVIDIKISSGSPHLNLVYSGMMYSINTQYIAGRFRDLRLFFTNSIKSFIKSFPSYGEKVLTSNLYPGLYGIAYDSASPGFQKGLAFKHILEMEPFELANSIGLGIITFDDFRYRVFTPSDKLEFIDFQNVIPQAQLTFQILFDLLMAPVEEWYSGSWEGLRPLRMGETYTGVGFTVLRVEVVEYDPTTPGLYSPVPNAFVTVGSTLDPFTLMFSKSDSLGFAVFRGLRPYPEATTALQTPIQSYLIDDEGRIIYAPDRGQHGAGTYPSSVTIVSPEQFTRNVVFKCGSAVMFDLTDPDTLQAAVSPSSMFGTTNAYSAQLRSYGGYETPLTISVMVMQIPGYSILDSFGYEFDPILSVAQVYAPPRTRFGFVVKSTSMAKTVAVYTNVTLQNQDGYGYYFAREGDRLLVKGGMPSMFMEMLTLAYGRYLAQADIQVLDPKTMENLNYAIMFNQTLLQMASKKDYTGFLTSALMAWGFSNKAYQSSLSVVRDAVTSIILVFALAIPFILLFSSLVYNLSSGFRSVALTLAVALSVALLLTVFHPGFGLAVNVPAIFIGTLIVALVIPVMFFLFSNFSTGLSRLRREVLGAHFLERSGFDVSFSAVSIGIGNLKKRKFRTVLTMLCIVIISFSLSSLTSVTEIRALRVTPTPTEVTYNGVLLRTANFAPLNRKLIDLVSIYISGKTLYAPRYWVYLPSTPGEGTAGTIVISSEKSKALIYAAVGISSVELKASFNEFEKILLEGSMFEDEEVFSALLPNSLAESLGVKTGEYVWVNGFRLKVTGILNTTAVLAYVKDADGFVDVLPMDTYVLSNERTPPRAEAALSPGSVIFVPAGLVELIPESCLTSVFIPADGMVFEELYEKCGDVFSAFEGLNIYLTYNGTVYRFSKENVISLFGFQFILIPMIIAGLITMSTILGGVMERIREGYIYSSLGLAPVQVGLMFFGENIIYAIVGSMTGYLGGISASYLTRKIGLINLPVNYTSSFVMIAVGLVIVLVLAASLYPFYRVSVTVTPSLERKWRLQTKPKGDSWDIPIPFRIKEDDRAAGMAVFLHEYLWNKRIERAGVFTVESVEVNKIESGIAVKSRVWLAPFEQNIKQDMNIVILKSKTEQNFLISMNLTRVSGPYDSWVRFNYPFIDEVRKQMLIWNVLNPEDREKYIRMARERSLVGEK
ncbi:MAG: FtsX-like permease family protein [Thermoproteota archaeon]